MNSRHGRRLPTYTPSTPSRTTRVTIPNNAPSFAKTSALPNRSSANHSFATTHTSASKPSPRNIRVGTTAKTMSSTSRPNKQRNTNVELSPTSKQITVKNAIIPEKELTEKMKLGFLHLLHPRLFQGCPYKVHKKIYCYNWKSFYNFSTRLQRTAFVSHTRNS